MSTDRGNSGKQCWYDCCLRVLIAQGCARTFWLMLCRQEAGVHSRQIPRSSPDSLPALISLAYLGCGRRQPFLTCSICLGREMPPQISLDTRWRPLFSFLYPPKYRHTLRLLHIQPSEPRCAESIIPPQRNGRPRNTRIKNDVGLLGGASCAK